VFNRHAMIVKGDRPDLGCLRAQGKSVQIEEAGSCAPSDWCAPFAGYHLLSQSPEPLQRRTGW